ncbi:GFA family protein [Candidatus Poriferisocius sp.]|uniref:GFA family protein n=1 Tax=Candidatus Poriferisocius sp. TaxID=3101276 RepID=UPI003B02B37E
MTESLSGRCMCGAVRYVIDGPARGVWNCHCERCRRWTGHFTAATSCRRDHLRLIADETLEWYHPEEWPDVAYGFCRRCGSSLFWKVIAPPPGESEHKLDTIGIWAGTLDPPTGLSTERVIYAEDASDYHTITPGIETLDRD